MDIAQVKKWKQFLILAIIQFHTWIHKDDMKPITLYVVAPENKLVSHFSLNPYIYLNNLTFTETNLSISKTSSLKTTCLWTLFTVLNYLPFFTFILSTYFHNSWGLNTVLNGFPFAFRRNAYRVFIPHWLYTTFSSFILTSILTSLNMYDTGYTISSFAIHSNSCIFILLGTLKQEYSIALTLCPFLSPYMHYLYFLKFMTGTRDLDTTKQYLKQFVDKVFLKQPVVSHLHRGSVTIPIPGSTCNELKQSFLIVNLTL